MQGANLGVDWCRLSTPNKNCIGDVNFGGFFAVDIFLSMFFVFYKFSRYIFNVLFQFSNGLLTIKTIDGLKQLQVYPKIELVEICIVNFGMCLPTNTAKTVVMSKLSLWTLKFLNNFEKRSTQKNSICKVFLFHDNPTKNFLGWPLLYVAIIRSFQLHS
eukprot:TRINITY_DN13801_c0_g2_i1.p5 TRINITY_DN13801_c0_g2~~TRINITY_DN13801_c0_g2_i1.p5  ORF type:complete len:159 (-),score=5.56 TRINITY_DN13801_c0_g2_i1:882-1358(-)